MTVPSKTSLSAWHALRDRLHELRIRSRWVVIAEGLFITGALICVLALSLATLESYLYLDPVVRLVLISASFLLLTAVLVRRYLHRLRRGFSDEHLARQVDFQYPELNDRVTVALQLSRQREEGSNASPALLDAAVTDAAQYTRAVDFKEADQRFRIAPAARRFGLSALLLLLAMAAFGAPLTGALGRLASPLTHFQPPQRTFLSVLPGDVEIAAGGQVTIMAEASGEIPGRAVMHLTSDGGPGNTVEMKAMAQGSYAHTLREIRESLTYVVEAGDAVSHSFRINAIDRPFIGALRLTYHYPAYTGLEPRTTTEGGDIVALKGTRVELAALDASRNLSEAALFLEHSDDPVAMKVVDDTATVPLTVQSDQRYRIMLRNMDGHESADPAWYRIIALPDRMPSLRILSPGRNTDLTENMVVSFLVSGTDDFGFSGMNLVYRKEPGGEERNMPIPVDTESTMISQPFVWDLSNENLFPGDVVSYRIELYDNDTISGPKRAVSRTYTLRFPSIEEIYDQIDETQEQQVSDMEDMLEEQEETRKKIEELNRTLEQKAREEADGIQSEELSWEQKKEIESVLTGQEQATDELLKAAEAIRATMETLEDHDSPSQELIDKMDQLRKLFQEIATPELLKAMQELQQALQSFDNEQLKTSMESFEFEQEEFLKRLERSLSILKQIRMEQQLMAAVRQTQDLAARQDELRYATENSSDSEERLELSEKQQRLGEETGSLQRDLESLARAMEAFRDMPAERVQEAAGDMERRDMTGNMDQIAEQLKVGRMQRAMEGQQEMSRALSGLNQQLQDIQDQLQEDRMREIAEGMRRAMHQLVDLSVSQETLNERTRSPGGSGTRINILTEDQQGLLGGASLVANDIVSIAQKTPFISPSIGRSLGETLNSMERAEDHLAEQDRDTAAGEQLAAMKSLNETVLALQRSMSNMANSGSSSGMMDLIERLQGMARQQTGINDQMDRMMDESNGSMDLETQAQVSRLAARQEALRKSLEQLRSEQQNHQEQILGRLQEIENEMDDTVRELQQFRIDPDLVERQQRILSRLLDASRSIRGQKREEKRRAAPGEDLVNLPAPDDLPDDLTRLERSLRDDILGRVEEGAYPREYEELIRAYFRALSHIPVVN